MLVLLHKPPMDLLEMLDHVGLVRLCCSFRGQTENFRKWFIAMNLISLLLTISLSSQSTYFAREVKPSIWHIRRNQIRSCGFSCLMGPSPHSPMRKNKKSLPGT